MSTLVTTALRHNASASNNVVLDSSGNVSVGNNATVTGSVGIGTATPIRRLTVAQNGTPEFVLQDTSQGTDLKNWRLYNASQNLAIGTLNDAGSSGTDIMGFSRSGRVTKPLQPMFYARGAETNYTLTNGADMPFNNAVFNIGSHFNASTFRFTAPVAGYYFIAFHLFVQTVTNRVSLKVNNNAFHNNQMQVSPGTNSWAGVISLAANDFVSVGDWQSTSGAMFYMGHCTFSGYLLG